MYLDSGKMHHNTYDVKNRLATNGMLKLISLPFLRRITKVINC